MIPEFKLLSLDEKSMENTENSPKIDNHSKIENENEQKLEKDEEKSNDLDKDWKTKFDLF